jgi:hypothetical protein
MLRARAAGDGVRFRGNLIKAWGGKGEGYDWPSNEHGIYIDAKGSSGSRAMVRTTDRF